MTEHANLRPNPDDHADAMRRHGWPVPDRPEPRARNPFANPDVKIPRKETIRDAFRRRMSRFRLVD